MKPRRRNALAALIAIAAAALIVAKLTGISRQATQNMYLPADGQSPIAIYPDYDGATIPPNIAPLNFAVLPPWEGVAIDCTTVQPQARMTGVQVRNGSVRFSIPDWRRFMASARGQDVLININAWRTGAKQARVIRLHVSADDIDPYVVYRQIPPIYNIWQDMSLCERDLRTFDERLLVQNRRDRDPAGRTAENACVNCHTFLNQRTDKMLIQVRPGDGDVQGPGILLVHDERALMVDTRTGPEPPASYTSWHPSGELMAYSRNTLRQFFHTAGTNIRDVVDLDSSLGLFLDRKGEKGKAFTIPQLARPDRLETYPTWSPDGKWLYFCSAPKWSNPKVVDMDKYSQVRYDLVRISYDHATARFGDNVETVVAADRFGHSVSLPRISPDGRWLVFVGHPYGSFPIYQHESDLYAIDLQRLQPQRTQSSQRAESQAATATASALATTSTPATAPGLAEGDAEPVRLTVNSDRCDSFHSWSSNSRWMIFSSKREDGVFARPYIAHVDAEGNWGKPFVMPQEDPTYYGRCLITYNLPELIVEPVKVSATELVRAMNKPTSRPIVTGATPIGGGVEMWSGKK